MLTSVKMTDADSPKENKIKVSGCGLTTSAWPELQVIIDVGNLNLKA